MASAAEEKKADENPLGPEGCYLLYESDSGGKLMLQYSKGEVPPKAVGFWVPGEGKKIQGFKFKSQGGRSELIKGIAGGDANRKRYLVGWCQFIKLAKAMNGKVIKFPNAEKGVEVDVYAFKQSENQPFFLDLDQSLVDVCGFDAIAVVPRHNVNFQGVKTLALNNFLERGNLAGATTTLG
mmetsp:Transcript_35060/g.49784  ORF Transcript_35060/g.49784 Transcript_35060/m.49784 type:complete len:181 (-) Transcript_35060:136-678(-)|eukprot:CAMPEP_0202458206 /NCGR_PEP_ID=MMETSP1360-20130828/22716_1 /ASSEMBLY_ACC=CAM_ASM_000848 /TAXON_ID=515479 /ORGANISM="Licmophora paradoxa, Strain CCMP2313" /LENGTH=180 /DNA_ID=CAMNT_0049078639 /DNA_START=41 /DNA_END=583 /DNA_ORIENTATION=+